MYLISIQRLHDVIYYLNLIYDMWSHVPLYMYTSVLKSNFHTLLSKSGLISAITNRIMFS